MSATGGANEDLPRFTIDETALAHQVHEAWEKKAAFWDEMMGMGAFRTVSVIGMVFLSVRVAARV
jgi:hypothetical protein